MDDMLLSAPTVNSAITDGKAIISGDFDNESAETLAAQIRAGSLPFSLNIVDYNEVGARLGAEALQTSVFGGAIGILLVFLFMLIVYRVCGLAADLALAIYIGLILEEQVHFLFNRLSFLGKFASKKKPATTLQTSPTFDLEFYKYDFAIYKL